MSGKPFFKKNLKGLIKLDKEVVEEALFDLKL
jgi:hypothetical protein